MLLRKVEPRRHNEHDGKLLDVANAQASVSRSMPDALFRTTKSFIAIHGIDVSCYPPILRGVCRIVVVYLILRCRISFQRFATLLCGQVTTAYRAVDSG